MEDLQSLVQQHRIKDFIIGRDNYEPKSYRPEEDAERWNQVITFYHRASPQMQRYIAKIIVEMFESHRAEEQIPALIIGRTLQIPELRDRVIEALLNRLDEFDSHVQYSLLVTAVRYRAEEAIPFILNALLKKGRLANFVTWSDALSQDETATDYDLWRLRMLARFYEQQDERIREEIKQQILSLSRMHKKAQTIMRNFLHKEGKNYPLFRQVVTAYFEG